MQRLVRIEKRLFCFYDFLDFELSDSRDTMPHETFGNKISFMKEDFA